MVCPISGREERVARLVRKSVNHSAATSLCHSRTIRLFDQCKILFFTVRDGQTVTEASESLRVTVPRQIFGIFPAARRSTRQIIGIFPAPGRVIRWIFGIFPVARRVTRQIFGIGGFGGTVEPSRVSNHPFAVTVCPSTAQKVEWRVTLEPPASGIARPLELAGRFGFCRSMQSGTVGPSDLLESSFGTVTPSDSGISCS